MNEGCVPGALCQAPVKKTTALHYGDSKIKTFLVPTLELIIGESKDLNFKGFGFRLVNLSLTLLESKPSINVFLSAVILLYVVCHVR